MAAGLPDFDNGLRSLVVLAWAFGMALARV